MKASQEKSQKNEKAVSFGALETKETRDRYSDSIDKLTSLVNKLDMEIDRREAQYKPAVYQIETEDVDRDIITIIGIGIGPIVEIEVIPIIEEEETFNATEIIGPIIEEGVGLEMVMGMEMAIEGMIEMIVDQIIEETITDKTMVTKGIEIEVQVKTMVGIG